MRSAGKVITNFSHYSGHSLKAMPKICGICAKANKLSTHSQLPRNYPAGELMRANSFPAPSSSLSYIILYFYHYSDGEGLKTCNDKNKRDFVGRLSLCENGERKTFCRTSPVEKLQLLSLRIIRRAQKKEDGKKLENPACRGIELKFN